MISNPYSTPPDFSKLPLLESFLRQTARGTSTINFDDPRAIRALSKALLLKDFGLDVEFTEDRLCPMIPGRFEYIQYILEIVEIHGDTERRGIDIGTGSSAVYPLIGVKSMEGLEFTATELDQKSFEFAEKNIRRNGLENRIRLVKATEDGDIFSGCDGRFGFTMCNPPFYSSDEEIKSLQDEKDSDPFAVCTGSSSEMITAGGEVEFTRRMITESLRIGNRIRWFSTLLGKFSSLSQIVKVLRDYSIENYAIKELQQGQTKRWIIVWSLQDYRLPNNLARPSSASITKLIPPPNTSHHTAPLPSIIELQQKLNQLFESLQIEFESSSESIYSFSVTRNTWSRESRRRIIRGETIEKMDRLQGKLEISANKVGIVELEFNWIKGKDRKSWLSLIVYLMKFISS